MRTFELLFVGMALLATAPACSSESGGDGDDGASDDGDGVDATGPDGTGDGAAARPCTALCADVEAVCGAVDGCVETCGSMSEASRAEIDDACGDEASCDALLACIEANGAPGGSSSGGGGTRFGDPCDACDDPTAECIATSPACGEQPDGTDALCFSVASDPYCTARCDSDADCPDDEGDVVWACEYQSGTRYCQTRCGCDADVSCTAGCTCDPEC